MIGFQALGGKLWIDSGQEGNRKKFLTTKKLIYLFFDLRKILVLGEISCHAENYIAHLSVSSGEFSMCVCVTSTAYIGLITGNWNYVICIDGNVETVAFMQSGKLSTKDIEL